MKGCIRQKDLIRLAAGQAPEAERTALLAHLAACPACATQHQQIRLTWELLGEWESTPPARDLSADVIRAASRPRPLQFPAWARLAACAALSAGIGVAAGLLTPMHTPTAIAQLSDEQVLETLGLDALGHPDEALSSVLTDGPESNFDEEDQS